MQLVEGEHYYREGALYVFTALFLLERGYCCGSGCRHCPYDERGTPRAAFRTVHPEAYATACAKARQRDGKS